MRRNTLFSTRQRALPFARQEIWQSIPGEQRRQCRELCEALLRSVLRDEDGMRSEEEEANDDRQDSRRTP